jgi:pentatricopeptide repeat protein
LHSSDPSVADMNTLSYLFTIVMQGFSRAGCYSEAFITYEMMKNTQIPVDEVAYSVLIDAIKFSGELSRLVGEKLLMKLILS